MIEYYICDLETTGLLPAVHDTIEISMIRVRDRLQITREVKASRPKMANLDALKITGRTMSDLYRGISRSQMVNDINEYLSKDGFDRQNRCIIYHNSSFDTKFIKSAWEFEGQEFPADMSLCTLSIMRAYTKQQGMIKPKLNLAASCDIFGIKRFAEQHTAKSDTRNTYLLWKEILKSGFDYMPFIKMQPHKLSLPNENDLSPEDWMNE
jgi:DNA polymerase III epsilon subunit-like protein